jgi:hypothetical protein
VQRLVVIGASGSGKTTLGRWVERHLGLPFTDLDDVFWRPGWQTAPAEMFRADVDRVSAQPRWVLAGNYSSVRDLIWPRADTLVWLDLPLATVMQRATRRALRQWRNREPICNGNRQTLWQMIQWPDGLLPYTLRNFASRRRTWPHDLAAYPNLAVHRLCNDRQVSAWQRAVQAGNTPVDR